MKRASISILLALLAVSCANMPDPSTFQRTSAENRAAQNINEEDSPLRIISIDVGQGDATLVISPTNESMLIDTGPPEGAAKIISTLEEQGIAAPDHIFITHYHADHTGGVQAILKSGAIPNGGIYDRGNEDISEDDIEFQIYADATQTLRRTASAGEHTSLGDVDVEVVACNGHFADGENFGLATDADENSRSIALLVSYGDFKMLVAGDMTSDVEAPLGELVGDIDVLKVSHHGSKTSTDKTFLASITPEASIISVGDGNDHSHPNSEVVERLISKGIKVYQTERGTTLNDNVFIAGGNIYIDATENGEFSVK